MPQTSQSGRVVTLAAVSKGNVYTLNPGDTSWGTPTNNTGDTPPLNFSGVMQSAPNVEKMWFADGVNWVYFDPRTNSVERWAPSAGELPVDSLNNTPRLICTWRGRAVLSGLLLDPQNWFMSKVNDPTNFDYGPDDPTPADAVAGNNAPQGLVGDVVTALIPYSDDLLIFGCDSSIFFMSGDPLANGQLDRLTDQLGIAYGSAWCKDPYGTLYFVGRTGAIYSLRPGNLPQRISQPVEQLVHDLDTGNTVILAQYEDATQSVHFFFTYALYPKTTTHLVIELRTNSWWAETFADNDHNPLCTVTFDGNEAGDRVMLMGGWDGYVRAFSESADDDDGTPIASSVLLGPIVTKDMDDIVLRDLQVALGEDSGSVTYKVYTGATAEVAVGSTPVLTGTLSAGRNLLRLIRAAGHGIYVGLSSTVPWSMEQIRALVELRGEKRRRGY